jgi:hypothetical protein
VEVEVEVTLPLASQFVNVPELYPAMPPAKEE